MAWEAIDIRTHRGLPVCDADRETILDVAERAVLLRDQDPEVVMSAAAKVGRHVHVIDNLRAYVDRATGRAIKKTVVAQTKRDRRFVSADLSNLADATSIDHIENKILVRELLDTLTPQDREIMLRRIEGCTFPEIDAELNLKARTAEIRYRALKEALRQVLSDKLDGRT